jgi:hypothetical protein
LDLTENGTRRESLLAVDGMLKSAQMRPLNTLVNATPPEDIGITPLPTDQDKITSVGPAQYQGRYHSDVHSPTFFANRARPSPRIQWRTSTRAWPDFIPPQPTMAVLVREVLLGEGQRSTSLLTPWFWSSLRRTIGSEPIRIALGVAFAEIEGDAAQHSFQTALVRSLSVLRTILWGRRHAPGTGLS